MALDTKTSLATRHLSKLHFVIEFTQYQSDIKMNKKTTKDPNLASASSTKTTPKKLKELAQISVELARLVATNTSASEELLLELARHKDERVRRSVATNPSTPVKAAMAVGSQFPEDLLNNPSFNLYILAEPNLLTGIGASALRALLKREVCPDSFFAYAASQDDEATQLAILTNPRAPKSIIQQLANSPHTRVQDTAKKHVALQSTKADESSWKDGFIAELLEEEKNRDKVPEAHQSLAYFLISQVDDLSELTEHELWVVRTAWTKEDRKNSFWMPTFDFSKGNYPASILQIAAKSEDRNFRGQIAQNPNTPTAVLELLAKDEDEDVQSSVTKNPNTPTPVLELLAKDEDRHVRSEVAKNPNTPTSVLKLLAKDESSSVRSEVAENPNTPTSVLKLLAKDEDEDVRSSVAKNPNTPTAVLELLAKDEDRGVRGEVAENPKSPISVLELLAKEEDEYVQSSVAKNPNTPASVLVTLASVLELLAKDESSSVRCRVAENPKSPTSVLELLAKDEDEDVRRRVAENPKSPTSVLELLAKDEDKDVRRRVAQNPNTPTSVLELLAKDEDEYVRRSVAQNPNPPTSVLELLAKDENENVRSEVAENPKSPISVLEHLAKDEDWHVRGGVANNLKTPIPILEILAKDADRHVRSEVAKNPNTPTSVLELLAKEEDEYVRGGVAQNPNTPDAVKEYLWSIYINWLYKNEIPESIQITTWKKKFISSHFMTDLQNRVDSAKKNKELSGLRNEFITRMVAGSKPSITRCVAFLLDDCPAASLAKYQRSSWWIERCAIAQNKNVPENVLKKLLNDANLLVQKSALFSFQKERIVQTPVAIDTLPTDKNNPKTAKEINWQFNFNTALETADKSLIGDTDQIVYRSFKNLAFMFWYKNFGQGISDTEMYFIKKSKKMHGVSISMNLNTPIPILEILAKDSNEDVRSSVAQNPNTPTPVLELLAKDGFSDVRLRVAENPKTPTSVLEHLGLSELLWVPLAHRRCHNEGQDLAWDMGTFRAAKDADRHVRSAVAKNPNTPTSVLEHLAKDEDRHVRSEVAKNPNTPTSVLELLAKDEDSSVRCEVAENPKTPTPVLEHLAKDEDSDVQSSVAQNPNTPISVLELLAKDESSSVRCEVAENPKSPTSVLELLAKDEDEYVRSNVAENPNTPTSVLKLLAKDEDERVRSEVAKNPKTPTSVLELLAKDEDSSVQCEVAENPKTPTPVLELLAKDGVYFLTSVAKNPNIPTSVLVTLASVLKLLAKDEDSDVRSEVAKNPKTPTSVLELLAKDEDEDVRWRVAENTNTPTSVLELLAKDENSSVRSSVAENPKTPTSVLKLLAKDEDERVRSEVAKSPITPIDSLMELLLEPYLEDSKAKEKIISAFGDVNTVAELRAEYLKKLCAGLIPSYERVYGLMLPDCPTSVLTKCAKSALWLERCAVAQNLATPVKLLQILEKDSNAIVRDAAKR